MSTHSNINTNATNEFPFGSVTLSLPDWNTIVNHIYNMQTSMKPLRSVLAHLEVSEEKDTLDALNHVSGNLWSGYHTLAILVREIRRLEGVNDSINF